MSEQTATTFGWTLGDRLAKARRVAGISRQEMGEYLGLSPAAVSYYEHDRRSVRLGILRLWALRTGAPLDWLRGDELDPTKGDPESSTRWLFAA